MRIDPSRLSRLLTALGQKPEATRSSASDAAETPSAAGHASPRDIKVLRKDIRSRLQSLQADSDDYDKTAASITIQEILRWEFGPDILDHPEFRRVTDAIVGTLLGDDKMAASLRKLARELSQ